MKDKNSIVTAVTLANASELAVNIAQQVLGGDVSDSLRGTPLNRSVLHNLAQARFQTKLTQPKKG